MPKSTVQVATAFIVLLLTSKIFAAVYVYKDEDGVMTFTNTPCTSEQLQQGCARVEKVRQWEWNWDANYDGKVTISDLSGWIKWTVYYPGDWVIYELLKQGGRAAEFLELTPASYGGTLSIIISSVVFPLVFASCILLFALIAVVGGISGNRPNGSNVEWQERMRKEYAQLPDKGLWKWLFNR